MLVLAAATPGVATAAPLVGRVRVLQRTRGGLELDEFGADGRRVRRRRFGLPTGVTPSLMGGSLRGGMVIVSTTTGAVAPYHHELVPLGGAGRPIALDRSSRAAGIRSPSVGSAARSPGPPRTPVTDAEPFGSSAASERARMPLWALRRP